MAEVRQPVTFEEAECEWGPLSEFKYFRDEPEGGDEVEVTYRARYVGRYSTHHSVSVGGLAPIVPLDATFRVVKKAAPPRETYRGIEVPDYARVESPGRTAWRDGVDAALDAE